MEWMMSAVRKRVDGFAGSEMFGYVFMVGMLLFTILCGYFLWFSGSLLVEALLNGWYSADATDTDATSFLLGYLYGFPSFLGVIGGILAMTTDPRRMHRFKILLFVPAAVWSALLVFDLLRSPEYWSQLFYHVPAMVLCLFALFGVIKRTPVPYLDRDGRE